MARSIPITVIGGYLGAGKTTLLNRLLREPGGRRLGVIVNDFGSIGIDAALLAAASETGVVNLPNGCVCCTLGGELFESLAALRDADVPPDQIVIEASGVADPAVAAAWGTSTGFAPGGVVVVAALDTIRRQSRDQYVGMEVCRQLRGADLIIATKADLCSSGDAEAARAHIADLADGVPLIDANVPVDVVLGQRPATTSPGAAGGHDGRYTRWEWMGGVVAAERLDAVLRNHPSGLLRLKGWVDTGAEHVEVQVVGRTVSMTPGERRGPGSRVEAIGLAVDFDPAALTVAFDRLAG